MASKTPIFTLFGDWIGHAKQTVVEQIHGPQLGLGHKILNHK